MKGYTHLAIGLGVGLAIKDTLGFWGIAMAGLGSLLPDLDHPGSLLGRRVPGASILGLKHRGWMHSILGLIVFSAIVGSINPELVPGIALGYLLHLIADSLNPSGVAWFYPLSKKRMHIIGIPTGSPLEYVFIFVLVYCLWNLLNGR